MLAMSFVSILLYGEESTAVSGTRSRAVMLAEEGLEAVRNIRDADFSALTAGDHGLAVSGNEWAFAGLEDETVISNITFERVISITELNPDSREVTSTVTWDSSTIDRGGSVSLATHYTYWPEAPPAEGFTVYVNEAYLSAVGTQLEGIEFSNTSLTDDFTIESITASWVPDSGQGITVIQLNGAVFWNEDGSAGEDGDVDPASSGTEMNIDDFFVAADSGPYTNNIFVFDSSVAATEITLQFHLDTGQTVEAVLDFTGSNCAAEDMSDMLNVYSDTADIGGAGDIDLTGISIENTNGFCPVDIDDFILTWTDSVATRLITLVAIGVTSVYPGPDAASGSVLNIDPYYRLEKADGVLSMTFRFDGDMEEPLPYVPTANNFDIKLRLTDGTEDNVEVNFGDENPPATIDTFVVTGIGNSYADLEWNAPSDDGTVVAYDIRYRSAADGALTDANWDDPATIEVTGEPDPDIPGTLQTMRANGLDSGTEYYFGIKSTDNMLNESAISNPLAQGTTDIVTMAELLFVDTSAAVLGAGRRELQGIDLTNTDAADPIEIASMTVSWTDTSRNIQIVDMGGSNVWNGNLPSPADVTGINHTIPGGTTHDLDRIRFSGRLNPQTNFILLFNMADGSTTEEIPVNFGETDPPDPVTDLNATGSTGVTVDLAWTEPADFGGGIVGSYDVRYSTSEILDEEDWDNATQVINEPDPVAVGYGQSMTVQGLELSTYYYFAIRSVDDMLNESLTFDTAERSTTATPPTMAELLLIDTSAAILGAGRRELQGINLTNTDASDPIEIASMTVSWTDTSRNIQIVDMGGSNVWNGNLPSPADVTGINHTIPGETTHNLDRMRFSGRLNPQTNFIILFTMADGSATEEIPVSFGETIPPADITDLTPFFAGDTYVRLTWTAPGDDGTGGGAAASYDVRYSESDIVTEQDWDNATQVTLPITPQDPGTTEYLTVTDLDPATTYYFAIKTTDDMFNESGLSNVAEETTISMMICDGVQYSGYCWFLAAQSQSCEDLCTSYGGYNEATRTYAGSDGTNEQCTNVLDAFPSGTAGSGDVTTTHNPYGGSGCFVWRDGYYSGYRYQDAQTPTVPDASDYRFQRLCACNGVPPNPILANPGDQVTQETLTLAFTLSATGAAPIAYSMHFETDPPGSTPTLDPDTGDFSWTPAVGDRTLSPYTVTFTATNGYGSDEQIITIDVSALSPCSGTRYGGYCWYIGGNRQSCDQVCASHGTYDSATELFAGSGDTPPDYPNCLGVLTAMDRGTGTVSETSRTYGGSGCFVWSDVSAGGRYQDAQTPTVSDAGRNRVYRACACTE